ncbi:hypothetical protein M0804_005411 [Polistes exclamans]|nr:hypothetical protein M0804_005411 [Polistes exclamans]
MLKGKGRRDMGGGTEHEKVGGLTNIQHTISSEHFSISVLERGLEFCHGCAASTAAVGGRGIGEGECRGYDWSMTTTTQPPSPRSVPS